MVYGSTHDSTFFLWQGKRKKAQPLKASWRTARQEELSNFLQGIRMPPSPIKPTPKSPVHPGATPGNFENRYKVSQPTEAARKAMWDMAKKAKNQHAHKRKTPPQPPPTPPINPTGSTAITLIPDSYSELQDLKVLLQLSFLHLRLHFDTFQMLIHLLWKSYLSSRYWTCVRHWKASTRLNTTRPSQWQT